VSKYLSRMRQQHFSGRRKLNATLGPQKQAGAQGLFQSANRLAQRGLGHSNPLRGPAEVKFLSDRYEMLQVLQVHGQERLILTLCWSPNEHRSTI